MTRKDQANIRWVHEGIDALIGMDADPLIAPLRCTSDEEVLEIVSKHTQGILDNEEVAVRQSVMYEIVNLDWQRRCAESAETMREINEARCEDEENQDMESQIRRGAKLIDELLILFRLWDEDYNLIDEALDYLQEIQDQYSEQPITVRLARILDRRRNDKH